MTGWEYLIVALPPFEEAHATQGHSAAVDVLNHEGAAGWEAVGINPLAGTGGAVLMKRRANETHDSQRGRPGRPAPS